MNINALLADLDNTRRMVGVNLRNALTNPVQHIKHSLARYAEQNLPTMAEFHDAQSVMPGMANVFAAKSNALAMNAMMPAQTVWHGSPHVFDRFDLSKVGTGQGAQAYGHGLYLAENPSVAKAYKESLAPKYTVEGVPPMPMNASGHNAIDMRSDLEQLIGISKYSPTSDIIPYLREKIDTKIARWSQEPKYGGSANEDMQSLVDWYGTHLLPSIDKKLEPQKISGGGALYKADLADDAIPKMLDWDKPLKEQPPAVRNALKEPPPGMYIDPQSWTTRWLDEPKTGADLYQMLERKVAQEYPGATRGGMPPEGFNAAAAVTEKLKEIGIPGIKYLDQGSRGTSGTGKWRINYADGKSELFDFKPNDDVLRQMKATAKPEGTRNYVVFDDSLLKILGRE